MYILKGRTFMIRVLNKRSVLLLATSLLAFGVMSCGDSGRKKAGVTKQNASSDATAGNSEVLEEVKIAVLDEQGTPSTSFNLPVGAPAQLAIVISYNNVDKVSFALGADSSSEVQIQDGYLIVNSPVAATLSATIVVRDEKGCIAAGASQAECVLDPSTRATSASYDKTHMVSISFTDASMVAGGMPAGAGAGGIPATGAGAGGLMGTMAGMMSGGAGGGAGAGGLLGGGAGGMMSMLCPLMGMMGGGGGGAGGLGGMMGMLGPLMGMLGGGTTLTSDAATQENQNAQ
jgi:hypothetical protein